MKRFATALTLICMGLLLGQPQPTRAATKPGLTLEPYIKELTIGADDASSGFDLHVTNNSGRDGNFQLTAVDFGSLNDSGGLLFGGVNESKLVKKYGLANWLTLPKQPVAIKQGVSTAVRVTLTNDRNLTPGGHYAGVFITPTFGAASPKININQTVTALVLAVKKGGDVHDLRLVHTSDDHSLFRAPARATLSFHNPGNVHVVPRGIVMLKQGDTVVAKGIINEQSAFVLPEARRKYDVALKPQKGAKPGWLTTTYTMQVDYRYDGYQYYASSHYQLRVWNAAAYEIGAVVVLGFGVVLLLAFRRKKSRPRRFKLFRHE
ncbi:MAG: hypothetical protein JWS12_533 [Candidatus Saccharibacteria bacterium]|nr:hypothetical protein [Candidatus Saccharibacteria bacterium]